MNAYAVPLLTAWLATPAPATVMQASASWLTRGAALYTPVASV